MPSPLGITNPPKAAGRGFPLSPPTVVYKELLFADQYTVNKSGVMLKVVPFKVTFSWDDWPHGQFMEGTYEITTEGGTSTSTEITPWNDVLQNGLRNYGLDLRSVEFEVYTEYYNPNNPTPDPDFNSLTTTQGAPLAFSQIPITTTGTIINSTTSNSTQVPTPPSITVASLIQANSPVWTPYRVPEELDSAGQPTKLSAATAFRHASATIPDPLDPNENGRTFSILLPEKTAPYAGSQGTTPAPGSAVTREITYSAAPQTLFDLSAESSTYITISGASWFRGRWLLNRTGWQFFLRSSTSAYGTYTNDTTTSFALSSDQSGVPNDKQRWEVLYPVSSGTRFFKVVTYLYGHGTSFVPGALSFTYDSRVAGAGVVYWSTGSQMSAVRLRTYNRWSGERSTNVTIY